MDKHIGKKKGPKRKTNVAIKIVWQCVMVVRDENDIWRVIRLDLDHNHDLCP